MMTQTNLLTRMDADTFDQKNPGLREFLARAAEWSEFAGKMHSLVSAGQQPSPRQLEAMQSMRTKVEAREAAEAALSKKPLDLARIREMFETVAATGHKRPTYRALGLVLSRAPDHGRNPGAIYVKDADSKSYLGKLIGTEYQPAGGADQSVMDRLSEIAANPLETAIRYGQKTGRCACCGLALTNRVSVDLGIGPICREKWGL